MTYKELHVHFLDGIKKTYTGTVHPNVFIRIFNDWGLPEWLSSNVSLQEGVERTQKQIDDLDRVTKILEYPVVRDNKIELPDDYVRLTSIWGRVRWTVCNETETGDYQKLHLERSDQKVYNHKSFFRKPSKSRPYYKHIGEPTISGSVKVDNKSVILFNAGRGNDIVACEIEYIRRPDMISEYKQGWEDIEYIDFRREQLLEIIDVCVRLYLERVKDERYQTFLNEYGLRNMNKV